MTSSRPSTSSFKPCRHLLYPKCPVIWPRGWRRYKLIGRLPGQDAELTHRIHQLQQQFFPHELKAKLDVRGSGGRWSRLAGSMYQVIGHAHQSVHPHHGPLFGGCQTAVLPLLKPVGDSDLEWLPCLKRFGGWFYLSDPQGFCR